MTPPRLETLNTKPSWHNRAGRVDRSACVTLTASQHWRQVPDDDWAYRYPARQPAYVAKGKCDRYAGIHFWARDLWTLHKQQQPYPLQGDLRSAKSNAMRAHIPRSKSTQRIHAERNDAVLGHGPVNPNRGVGFNLYKRLGLDCMWHTTVRIERYVQHYKLKQHFFVCPVCGGPEFAAGQRTGATKHAPKLPAGRVTKLYLPLCTEREVEDAHIAETWLNANTSPNRPLSPIARQLIERYGELFERSGGRRLRCRQCLGLRYGEVKRDGHPVGGQGSRRAVSHSPRAVGHEPHPPVNRDLTEQALFLSNLPKLLSPLPDVFPALPTRKGRTEVSTDGQSSASFNPHQGDAAPSPQPSAPGRASPSTAPPPPGVDTLPASAREQLLMRFAASMSAFKKLEKVRCGGE